MKKTHILLIDDHAMFRTGLRMVLEINIPNMAIFEAGALNEALHDTEITPDIVLLDIHLPGLNGLEGIALIKRKWPAVPVLVLSAHDEAQVIRSVLARGATGFLSKAETVEKIIETVRLTLQGSACKTDEAEGLDNEPPHRLTPRQCEVLDLLCRGMSNKLIARELTLSENTVRTHVQAILGFLQVSSRTEAVFMARNRGLVS